MSQRARRWVIGLCLFALIWVGSVVVGAAMQNPLTTAVAAAAEVGNWPAESVRLRRGSYSALPFVFLTSAEVVVATPTGEPCATWHQGNSAGCRR